MSENKLSICDVNVIDKVKQINETLPSHISEISYDLDSHIEVILISALASQSVMDSDNYLLSFLASNPKTKIILSSFNSPQLTRKLKKIKQQKQVEKPRLENKNNQVFYGSQQIGEIKLLYKPFIPGELQAKLAYLSTIDRFLEYLQKKFLIGILNESNYNIKLFIPYKVEINFDKEWKNFIKNIMFSLHGDNKNNLFCLLNTFILLINELKLAKSEEKSKGFGMPRLPILTKDQAYLIMGWYYAVIQKALSRDKLTESHLNKLTELESAYSEKILEIKKISLNFKEIAVNQITPTPANFNLLLDEISKLFLIIEQNKYDPIPKPLLYEFAQKLDSFIRLAGDDTNKFCYCCGINLKGLKYPAHKLVFESPTQRRQSSSSGEKAPNICSCCASLSFASPLKISHRNIIIKLDKKRDNKNFSQINLFQYLRMLTNKSLNLTAGQYLLLPSEYIFQKKEVIYACNKLGKVQYARAKIADIFPLEVLTDFDFSLVLQGSQEIKLESRHLIFIKGLMESYAQKIIISGKEINLKLGEAIRYIEQDLPYLADYTLAKVSNLSSLSSQINLEKVRANYYQELIKYIEQQKGNYMSESQLQKRANLYRDVAGLTGITYAFANSLESTAKEAMKPEDAEREVSKLIEQIENGFNFCYYATLGDEKKTNVQAKLFYEVKHHFIYEQTAVLLNKLGIDNREETDEKGNKYIQLYADDIIKAYEFFSNPNNEHNYASEKDWKTLTYHLKLSLYTRFPELVRKLNKSKGDN